MSGKDLTKGEDMGRVKEQGRAEVWQRKEAVEERFEEDRRGDSSSTKAEERCETVVLNKRAILKVSHRGGKEYCTETERTE